MATAASSDIKNQVRSICESDTFRSAPQASRLLTFLTDATLEDAPLKESVIGTAFFGRPSGYDPQADPVVRTEVRRLRLKLGEYYGRDGATAPILIEIPPGGYKARFTLREAPRPEVVPEVPQPPAPATGNSLPRKALVAAAILVISAGAWLLSRTMRQAAAPRRAVAVFRLRDLAGATDTAWLGSALSKMVAGELSANTALRVIPLADGTRTRLDLSMGDTDSLSPDELNQIRRKLDADLVVTGSYASIGPAGTREYRIDLQLYDARTGQQAQTVSDTDTGDERTLFDMVSRAGSRIMRQLGVDTNDTNSPSSGRNLVNAGTLTGVESARALCLKADLLPYGSPDKERLYLQSLEVGRKEKSGPWEVDPITGLAKIYAEKDHARAADFYRQAYEVTLKYFGPERGATAAARIQWARAQLRMGHSQEAIEQIKAAIPVARRGFPPDSLRLWNLLHDSIHACNEANAFQEAESYSIEALAMNDRLHLPPTSERWGMLYWDLGRARRGEKNYRDALEALEKAEADFQQFPDTRASQVRADIEQVKAEQRAQ